MSENVVVTLERFSISIDGEKPLWLCRLREKSIEVGWDVWRIEIDDPEYWGTRPEVHGGVAEVTNAATTLFKALRDRDQKIAAAHQDFIAIEKTFQIGSTNG